MEKRDFLKACGAGFLSSLFPHQAAALSHSDQLFFSAAKTQAGNFVAAILSETGDIIAKIPLPARGHDVTFCPINRHAVVFARRPGTFAIVFDTSGNVISNIASPMGRHFYGHGQYSIDGKLLFTTQNDFNNVTGIIGVHDVGANYRQIAEWESGGIGPHDILLTKDGKHLCVANGGIETHPDFGRTKLNLAAMAPNISWIDIASGHRVARHDLPDRLHKLSMRHLSMGANSTIWFGAQNQGAKSEQHQLVGSVSLDKPLSWLNIPGTALSNLRGYVGSIAASLDGSRIAVASPLGNSLLILDQSGNVLEQKSIQSVSGIAALGSDMVYSTGHGVFSSPAQTANQTVLQFDNHLSETTN